MTTDETKADRLRLLAEQIIEVGCPCDTNRDGDCGRTMCPWCGDISLVRAARRLIGRAMLGQ